jgi:hypothetical protein
MRPLLPQARSSNNETDASVVSWLTEASDAGARNAGLRYVSYLPGARNAGLLCLSYLPLSYLPCPGKRPCNTNAGQLYHGRSDTDRLSLSQPAEDKADSKAWAKSSETSRRMSSRKASDSAPPKLALKLL